ncbi:MAG: hypothetical protein JNM12_15290 [Alphaproteobacteria bacterium]|nr:hypothetical protein [Alphaproteobacteria bacterium]
MGLDLNQARKGLEMLGFWVSLGAFIGSHILISRTAIKPWLVARLGMKTYLVLYSVLSILLLSWLVKAAQAAPRTDLWPWSHALYWFPALLMPLAFALLVSGFVVSNPLSIAPKDAPFDHEKPALTVALTRHPILWGFALWSFSHLIVNGEFPLALMFFVFLLFSLAGIFFIDRKRRKDLGDAKWTVLTKNTSAFLFCSHALWTRQFRLTKQDVVGMIGGLLLYTAFRHLHLWLFGIDPALHM